MTILDYRAFDSKPENRKFSPLASGALVLSLCFFFIPVLGAVGGGLGTLYLLRIEPKRGDEIACAMVAILVALMNLLCCIVLICYGLVHQDSQ